MEWWILASIALWCILGTGMNIWVVRKCFPELDTDIVDACLSFALGFAWPLVVGIFLFLHSDFGKIVIFKAKKK